MEEPETLAVPNGYIADIITHLEMTDQPVADIPLSELTINRWQTPDPEDYLALFRNIGEPWLWLSRLLMDDAQLSAIIHDGDVEIFDVREGDQSIGLIELDFRKSGECEIAFLGLIPSRNGKGHGRWLMAETLDRAWRKGIERVWLHTCTLDSPAALPFYQKAGFRAYKREISVARDPRLTGLLPETAGPHIPLIR